MLRAGALLASATLCSGHFLMCMPPSWQDKDGTLGCKKGHEYASCTAKCSNGKPGTGYKKGCTGGRAPGQIENYEGCVSEWYTNGTLIPGKPTIPIGSPMLAMRYQGDGRPHAPTRYGDWSYNHPWRAPGTAPVHSPCGHDGGNPLGCPPGNPKAFDPNGRCDPRSIQPCDGAPACEGGGYAFGPDAREALGGNTRPAEWKVGGVADVAWSISVNHGGGYSYRLCPKTKNLVKDLTEECFQRTPLDFVGDTQWFQMDNGTRIAATAVRTTKGTHPAGSMWTRIPIPSCYNPNAHPAGIDTSCKETAFPSPITGSFPVPWDSSSRHGLYGFLSSFYEDYPRYVPGGLYGPNIYIPDFAVVDQVQVPASIAPGDYVLSFRCDSEQTDQVWNTCGDVRITA